VKLMPEPTLVAEGLSRYFGGLAAVNQVSLELVGGEIHAVIGPNGAGKSTLINLLSGHSAPSAGRIRYEGTDITGYPPDRVARLGIGRSFQRVNVFPEFSIFENCRLAAQARFSSSMRFFRSALSFRELNQAAERVIALVGLREVERVAQALSHGERRQLEIAMTLATRPKVLLLDEPLAGMGADEGASIIRLIEALGRDHAILLVEHDMDAVFSVAQRLTVMVDGRVVESGDPTVVRANPEVRKAYLGTEELA
jgi:branched-chain amino acid transport system ATP-binding protein